MLINKKITHPILLQIHRDFFKSKMRQLTQKYGQHLKKIVHSLSGIVKNDHRSVGNIRGYPMNDFAGRYFMVVVFGHDVPQDDFKPSFSPLVLNRLHTSVRRPKQPGVAQEITLLGIFQEFIIGALETIDVGITMVTHGMSLIQDFLKERRILFDMLALTKKGSFSSETVEQIQHLRGDLRIGTIVKGKVNRVFVVIEPSDSRRVNKLAERITGLQCYFFLKNSPKFFQLPEKSFPHSGGYCLRTTDALLIAKAEKYPMAFSEGFMLVGIFADWLPNRGDFGPYSILTALRNW